MHSDWETFTYDEEWLRAAVRIEEEADCDISAGFDWGANLGAVMANPEKYSQFAQLLTCLSPLRRGKVNSLVLFPP